MVTRPAVRPVQFAELDRILAIEQASFGRFAYDRNLFADYFHSAACLFLVAERGTRIGGYLIAAIRRERAELVSIAVDPRFRRKGLASRLLESLFRRLRRRRVISLGLMVRRSNAGALAFYRGYGFARTGLVRGYYEDGADGLRMSLRFPQRI